VCRQGCREILGVKLQASWVVCQDIHRTILDRAFIYPAQEPSSLLTVAWNREVFDYAVITVRLQHATAGIGYAGAWCPKSTYPRASQCKVDLKKQNGCREEWERLLQLSLDQADESVEKQPASSDKVDYYSITASSEDKTEWIPVSSRALRPCTILSCLGYSRHVGRLVSAGEDSVGNQACCNTRSLRLSSFSKCPEF
jgi:hypothetical protein